jgi:transcriptional regulator with XRE-family HTH domain
VNIGARIRATRKAAGLSQEEVARRAGLSLKGMGEIERGDIGDPHFSSLVKIAHALRVHVESLIKEEEPALPLGEASQAGRPKRKASVFDVARDGALRQAEQDRQAIVRAGESHSEQIYTKYPENEAMKRLLEYSAGALAEGSMDLARHAVELEQENTGLIKEQARLIEEQARLIEELEEHRREAARQ